MKNPSAYLSRLFHPEKLERDMIPERVSGIYLQEQFCSMEQSDSGKNDNLSAEAILLECHRGHCGESLGTTLFIP